MNDKEIISNLKKYQKDIKSYMLIIIALFFVIPVSGLKAIFDFITHNNWIFSLIINVASVIILQVVDKKRCKVKREKKEFIGENIVRRTLAEIIDIKEYKPNMHIERNTVKESPIMPEFDSISGSDYISGSYKGAKMIYSDVLLRKKERYRDRDGGSRIVNELVFKGHFLRLQLNSQIDGYVKIIERETPRKKGAMNNVLKSVAALSGNSENTIEVENEAFNEQFSIHTDNDHLAFYILTPHFMESIVAADEYAKGSTNIFFNKTYVDIAIDNRKDSFEAKKLMADQKSLDATRQQIKDDLNRVIAIVDQIMTKDRLFS